MIAFHATTITAEVDDEAEIPVFRARLSDADSEQRYYLQFERLITPDDQAIKFGFDKPHIEICGQGLSGYNLVDWVKLADAKISVYFTEKGMRALRMREPYEVSFDPDRDLGAFITVMREIFGDRMRTLNGLS